MNPTIKITALDRTFVTGLIIFNLALEASARNESAHATVSGPAHSDASQGEFSPSYLAQRLGLAQKSTTLLGICVKEKAGRRIGKLEDIAVDLRSGRILCALVSGGGDGVAAIPGKAFFSADERGALLNVNDVRVEELPKANLPAEARKCGELIGRCVVNNTGESLGRVVNVMVDLPTERVVFVVVSLAGSGSDLYVVPPKAIQSSAENGSLVLNVDKAKISSLAHSDGFFWSNLAEANWGVNACRAFGVPADFDVTANNATTAKVEVPRVEAQPVTPAPVLNDRELSHEILAAMMHDNVQNPIIFKHAQIKPQNGQVTLCGWVKNENQRSKLLAIAASVAGPGNVHDEIQIK